MAGRFELLGIYFCAGFIPEEAESALRAAHAKLHFIFSPRLPVEHPATGRISVDHILSCVDRIPDRSKLAD